MKKNLLLTLLFFPFIIFTLNNRISACEIWDVEADIQPCNEDGTFYVLLTFEYENVGDDGFRVQGGGYNHGDFSYDDLPVQLGPLEGDGTTIYEFVVIDNQIEGCSDWTEIGPIDCEGAGECNIGEMEVEVLLCNDEGMFFTTLDFEYENVSEVGFNAYVNDEYFGEYDYEDLPIEIGPLEGDGETIHNFFIVDAEFVDCHGWHAIDPVDCEEGGECEMGGLEIEILPCNEAGNFYTLIDFEYANVSEEGFKLFVNDDLFEMYEYEDLPIEVGPLEGDGETSYHFLVRDIVYDDCASDGAIDPVDCEGGNNCEIYDLDVEVLDCNEEGNFFAELNFEYAHVGEAGFDVYVNDDYFGGFLYNEIPVELGTLEGDGVTEYTFTVVDKTFDECETSKSIEPVDCDEGSKPQGMKGEAAIYPNPILSNGVLKLNDKLSQPRDLYIYNIKGKEVFRKKNLKKSEINIAGYALDGGIYFYKLVTPLKTYRGNITIN